MKKTTRIKRRAAAHIVHASTRAIEVGTTELLKVLRASNAEGSESRTPIKDCLTQKEYKLIAQRRKKIAEAVLDLRKIANHMEKTARESA